MTFFALFLLLVDGFRDFFDVSFAVLGSGLLGALRDCRRRGIVVIDGVLVLVETSLGNHLAEILGVFLGRIGEGGVSLLGLGRHAVLTNHVDFIFIEVAIIAFAVFSLGGLGFALLASHRLALGSFFFGIVAFFTVLNLFLDEVRHLGLLGLLGFVLLARRRVMRVGFGFGLFFLLFNLVLDKLGHLGLLGLCALAGFIDELGIRLVFFGLLGFFLLHILIEVSLALASLLGFDDVVAGESHSLFNLVGHRLHGGDLRVAFSD